jgi:hypothetical protein
VELHRAACERMTDLRRGLTQVRTFYTAPTLIRALEAKVRASPHRPAGASGPCVQACALAAALFRWQLACCAARLPRVLLAERHPCRAAAQCTQPPCSGGWARLTRCPACARATSGFRSTTGPRCACSAAWASRSTHARGSGCLRRAPACPAAREQGRGALGMGRVQCTSMPVVSSEKFLAFRDAPSRRPQLSALWQA